MEIIPNYNRINPMTDQLQRETTEIVWGAAGIGLVINRTPKQVFHMLEKGRIPAARKIGGVWAASRRELLRQFEPISSGASQ
jgi:hypothetical protein